MKYTASEKIDIDKIKEEVNKKGFSDRAKKYIGSALLAAQIAGVSPALANTDNVSRYDNNIQYEEIFNPNSDMTPGERVDLSIELYSEYLEKSNVSDEIKHQLILNLDNNLNSIEFEEKPRSNSR